MPRALLIKKRKYEQDEPSEPSSDLGDDAVYKKKSRRNRKDGHRKQRCNYSDDENSDQSMDCQNQNLHYLKWVLKNNVPVKVWECGMCKKEFNHQYTLARHIPVHTGERNYVCIECGKSFRQASTLCRHKAIHSEERPYQCSSCERAFNRSSTLIAHTKTHSKDKPHLCPICKKGFHQKGNLKNHVFTHTNERPYRCDMCEKSFNQMSNLVCHKAHAHLLRAKHQCHLCGKEFPRKYNLRKHEEYHHGIKYGTANTSENSAEQPVVKGRPLNSTPSKTITLPNGDKTIQFLPKPQNVQKSDNAVSHLKKNKDSSTHLLTTPTDILQSLETGGNDSEKLTSSSSSTNSPVKIAETVTPNPENQSPTKQATIVANLSQIGNSSLALLKPSNGNLLLVKFVTGNGKQMLIPASYVDIQSIMKSKQSEIPSSTIEMVPLKIPVINCTNFASIGNLKLNTSQNKESNQSPNLKIIPLTGKVSSTIDNDSIKDNNSENLSQTINKTEGNKEHYKTSKLSLDSLDFQEDNEDIATLMKSILKKH